MKTNLLILAVIAFFSYSAKAQQNLDIDASAFTTTPIAISLAAYDATGSVVGYSAPYDISSATGKTTLATFGTLSPGFYWAWDPSSCGCNWTIGVVAMWNAGCSTYGTGTPVNGCAQYDVLSIGDPAYGWINADCFEYSGVCGGTSVGSNVHASLNPTATPNAILTLTN